MKRAWLGLGGNVGKVQDYMQSALRLLDEHRYINVVKISSFYKTPPWGLVEQASFINLCCEIKTTLVPEDLLKFCLEIEIANDRIRHEKWGPRTLDIDLLLYEGVDCYVSDSLTLPHPFITQRPFVLRPLNEIAPYLTIDHKTVHEWNLLCYDDNIVTLETQSNELI